jgi:hypothetical protein
MHMCMDYVAHVHGPGESPLDSPLASVVRRLAMPERFRALPGGFAVVCPRCGARTAAGDYRELHATHGCREAFDHPVGEEHN